MTENLYGRRRSVDVGGLALALNDGQSGHGWGGWEDADDSGTRYAEVLIDVRAHTENIVNVDPTQSPPFIEAEPVTRDRLVESLGSWNFEPHKLPEEQVVACSYILFEALFRIEGMQEAVGVSVNSLGGFLQHLRHMYREPNSYHNFHHALDVFQATYHFLYRAGMVPPVSIVLQPDVRTWRRDRASTDGHLLSCLTEQDLLALLIAAIGHDAGHPGLSNAFMKNAKTPLAVVYDDKSVLEQMHYSLVLQVMRHNGLAPLLDRPGSGQAMRKLLLGTVLATDMSVHAEFMANFQELVAGHDVGEHKRRVLVCQALIKCADISNPSRPYNVSKHWAAALESEWTSQLLLEQHLHLPATVKPSDHPLGQAKGQVFFISAFAKPLFELVAQGIPELAEFAQQCRENLAIWTERSEQLTMGSDEQATPESNAIQTQRVDEFLSAFPPTLPDRFRIPEEPLSPLLSNPSISSSHSSGSSHYESCESGPPSPSALSPVPTPQSPSFPHARIDISTPSSSQPMHSRPPSITSVSSYSTQANDATAAIRAAYKASVRKKKSFHRSSWNPTGSASTGAGRGYAFAQTFVSPDGPGSLTADSSPLSTHSSSPLTPTSPATIAPTNHRPSPLGPAACSQET
ncbi:HD-domain/PDEase-like protein [Rhodofomes roseus]|uniref:HD-domain/PDEase-like protein n=1 Tax=Rhodofomes roseus TaxID=34475 RepID=A0ABQ8K7B6_9APHY|nr:HD-domain/PDEase-like protein [Rhodofomes roseus]KAH9833156.1 HD-domain/PDEase-like protein [Rhodofomes roseus]